MDKKTLENVEFQGILNVSKKALYW